MSKKQRASMLMEAAERVFRCASWHSCSSILVVSAGDTTEADKYADYVGVERHRPAFSYNEQRVYSMYEEQLTRALAILMYREAVLAGEV